MCVCVCVRACVCACMRVCVALPPRLLITSGVILISYDWLNKLYSGYMAIVIVVSIINGHGLGIDTRRGNLTQ